MIARVRQLGQARNDFVAEAIRASGGAHVLDIGCGSGNLLALLPALERTGVDMNEAALREARERNPGVAFVHQSGASLPFPDATFDAAILSEVIEHVGDENKQLVIDEAHRVLQPGGTFVLTAPHAGALAWTDPLDVKRRLPRVYGVYRRLSGHTPETAPAVGHKHLDDAELRRLFARRFRIVRVTHCGPVTGLLYWLQVVAVALHAPATVVDRLNRVRGWESGIACPPRLAYSVRLVATRLDAPD